MSKWIYKEEQRFRRWDVLGLVIFLMALLAYRVFIDFWGQKSQAELLLLGLFLLLVLAGTLVLLLNIRLITKIDADGIRYQYYPFHYKQKKVYWKDIEACELVATPAVAELSGWGVSFDHRERFHSVSGRNGLRLRLKGGRRLFIGSANLDDLAESMAKIKDELQQ